MAYSILQELEKTRTLLKPRDIMRMTGLGKTKVYEMINSGEIPKVEFSNHTRGRKRSAEAKQKGEALLVDPATWAFQLRHANPMLNEAARRG